MTNGNLLVGRNLHVFLQFNQMLIQSFEHEGKSKMNEKGNFKLSILIYDAKRGRNINHTSVKVYYLMNHM